MIAIAMATYNGARFVAEQIESIINNDYSNWILYIRDDCSSDQTVEIINRYMDVDDRIQLVASDNTRLGHSASFNAILTLILENGHEYFVLCDQDDHWLPDRLTRVLNVSNTTMPELSYTDLQITDANLQSVGRHFFDDYDEKCHGEDKLHYLLMENSIPGCTMSGNRQLLKHILPIPKRINNHDWWIALNAAIFGEIKFIDKPLIKYRQHEYNQIGASSFWAKLSKSNVRQILRKQITETVNMIDEIRTLSSENALADGTTPSHIFTRFISIYNAEKSAVRRARLLYREGYRTHHLYKWMIHLIALHQTSKARS